MPTRTNMPSGRAMQLWVVREVKAPRVLAVEGIEFDPGGVPHTAFSRRDSLVAAPGDSTKILSTFVGYPLLGPSDSSAQASGAVKGSILSAAERMRLGASRLMWEAQLKRLERR
jgi:hypothetical protein